MGFSYNELRDMTQSWVEEEGSEYAAQFPNFVKLAVKRLVTDLNFEIFDLEISVPIFGGNPLVSKPSGVIATRSMWLVLAGRRTPLIKKSRDWCTMYSPDPSSTGTPKYFCEYSDTHWSLAKAPSVSGAVQATTIQEPAAPSAGNQNTWLSTNSGDLLFCCILMESEHWTKADDRYADMKTKYYQELLPTRRMQLRNLIRDGDYTPMKPAAAPVDGGK